MYLRLLLSAVLCSVAIAFESGFPLPFYRALYVVEPPAPLLNGTDVIVLQRLISRSKYVPVGSLDFTGIYDGQTEQAVLSFQRGHGLLPTGIVEANVAQTLLDLHYCDGFKFNDQPASSLGDYLYKIVVPIRANRSVEVLASLFDKDNHLLHTFRVRAHGHDLHGNSTWPNFNNTDPGRNSFSPDGNTPTGLAEVDLNSPEGIPRLYGPYPINRVVTGMYGNSAFLLPHIRNGILLHTGEWPGWNPSEDMPNSAGCIHAHPDDVETIWQELVKIGVSVRKNPFGKLPYPYKPQGIIVVEQVDPCPGTPSMNAILLVRESNWNLARDQGVYTGNPEDKHDGFIHLCTSDTVVSVQTKHFANVTDLLAVEYDMNVIAPKLHWAIAGDGLAYPHYYGNLTTEAPAVVGVVRMPVRL